MVENKKNVKEKIYKKLPLNNKKKIIIDKIFKNDDKKVKKEALMCIANMTTVENENYMKKLIEDNIFMIDAELLQSDNSTFIIIGLEMLANLLAFGDKKGQKKEFQNECEKLGIIDTLEKLQMHESQIIYEKTLQIFDAYFELAD